jgi:hypothetical protein
MYTKLCFAQTKSAAVLRKGRKLVMDQLEKQNGLRGSAHTANKRKGTGASDVSISHKMEILARRSTFSILRLQSVPLPKKPKVTFANADEATREKMLKEAEENIRDDW